MKQRNYYPALMAALAITCGSAFAAPETYKVDTVHSSVVYKIKHMGVANHYGRFNDVQGTITMDEAAPESASISIEVKPDSIDSGNQKRDEHVMGPDFLNTKQFPAITFKSTSAKKSGDKQLDITGDLNLHGVTKPVTAKLEFTGKGKGRGNSDIAGAEAKFEFKRSDFGMTGMVPALSDEVGITVSIEGIKQGGAAPAAQ